MQWNEEIREARRGAGLSQRALAARISTSQATISAYESGRKQPTVAVLERLLTATGRRLQAVPDGPSAGDLTQAASRLVEAVTLAEALPFRRDRTLSYPRLPVR